MKYLKRYEKHLINETLTKTYKLDDYGDNLKNLLNKYGVVFNLLDIYDNEFKIDILNIVDFNFNSLKYIINIISNLFGYFPSYMWLTSNFGIIGDKYDENIIKKKIFNLIKLKIKFEAKFDKNDILLDDYLYHLSPVNKKNKIIKYGLQPKSNNRKSIHPERISLFYDIENTNDILKSLKINDKITNKKTNYNLYKIKLPDGINIHRDPNYFDGYFVYEIIPPEYIEIVEENI